MVSFYVAFFLFSSLFLSLPLLPFFFTNYTKLHLFFILFFSVPLSFCFLSFSFPCCPSSLFCWSLIFFFHSISFLLTFFLFPFFLSFSIFLLFLFLIQPSFYLLSFLCALHHFLITLFPHLSFLNIRIYLFFWKLEIPQYAWVKTKLILTL